MFNILIALLAAGALVLALMCYLEIHTHEDEDNKSQPEYQGLTGTTRSSKPTGFYATFKSGLYPYSSGAILKWDEIRYDPGQNFDNQTGAYIAPYMMVFIVSMFMYLTQHVQGSLSVSMI